jgi:hypothetical protein
MCPRFSLLKDMVVSMMGVDLTGLSIYNGFPSGQEF